MVCTVKYQLHIKYTIQSEIDTVVNVEFKKLPLIKWTKLNPTKSHLGNTLKID